MKIEGLKTFGLIFIAICFTVVLIGNAMLRDKIDELEYQLKLSINSEQTFRNYLNRCNEDRDDTRRKLMKVYDEKIEEMRRRNE